MIKKAEELIQSAQKAIVIFTRGDKFSFDHNGDGFSGNWKAGEKSLQDIDKVIIYRRDQNVESNQVYEGEYRGWSPSEEAGRKIIHFSGLKNVGSTSSNWLQFGGIRGAPIFYMR